MYISLCDPVVHTGTTFSVSRSSSETDQATDCKSSLVTTPSSRMIPDKLRIEVTKDPIHHVGKNGEHFYGENSIYEYPSKRHIKPYQCMGILHTFSNCVKATFNHGLSPSEVDWGDPKGEPTEILMYTSSGCMLMEVDWGDKLKLNYTSCGCMLMEGDWGDKLIVNSMVNWGTHETHPNRHNISEVDWGGHDSSSNHMNEFLLSEVDWGAHDSSFFLFLVNIDYDAKPMEFFTQGLWGELQQKMSSTLLIGYLTDSLDTGQTEDDVFNPKPIDPELDNSEQLTGKSIQPYLSLVGQLQWLVTLGRLVIHAQVITLSMFRSAPRKLQRIYGYLNKIINFHRIQSKYDLREMLSKHWDLYKILPMIANLLMTCGPTTLFPNSAFVEHPFCPNIWDINHTTLKFPSSTHTHKTTYL